MNSTTAKIGSMDGGAGGGSGKASTASDQRPTARCHVRKFNYFLHSLVSKSDNH